MLSETHRFSVADFHLMGETGVLRDEHRVELLDGEIIPMMPIGPYHASLVAHLSLTFARFGENRWLTWPQNPLRLSDYTEVQPDIVLLALRDHRYQNAAPGPEDAHLAVEVADSTLTKDRGAKLPLYARACIDEVWIINIPERQVEVYREPNFLNYSAATILKPGQSASPAAFPDVSIPVADLFR